MARFSFEAINAEGIVLSGQLDADSEREALRQLERRQLTAVALTPATGVVGKPRRAGRLQRPELILCFHEIAIMLKAGVALAEAVAAQGRSAHHPRLLAACEQMSAALSRGQSFSESLAATDLPLPAYFHTLIRAGEQAGLLAQAMSDGVAQLNYDFAVQSEARQALTYPAILVLAGIGAIVLMFTFVVPKFATLLTRAHDLPLLAQVVLTTGMFAHDHFVGLLAAVLGAAVVAVQLLRSPERRNRLEERIERLPLLGVWRVESETARWAKVLGTLLGNRVALMDALGLAQSAIRSAARRGRLDEAARAVRSGSTLADALEAQGVLTSTGYNLVRVGERAGELPAMLQSLGELSDQAGRSRMKQALALLEPLAILVIGSVIGLIMIGIILAITSANEIVL